MKYDNWEIYSAVSVIGNHKASNTTTLWQQLSFIRLTDSTHINWRHSYGWREKVSEDNRQNVNTS